ncbi:hypothetical protein [Nonlabens tegetincola]|uniref:hypothetical protein n=1 Tax=Nonlabens tegetincola TaxID=323273 RepID=UPI000CF575DE|nr:hypothetical protein [Nonlabens tegetincola]PQJ20972.1 hypothetical protein BST93_00455 [Nonlabens tegetincola]
MLIPLLRYTDEDGSAFTINETVTALVENTNGTVTYTDEAGNDTIIDVTNLETLTEIAENTDGTFTYTDEDGVDTIIDISNLETLLYLLKLLVIQMLK